ncbi:hypothetical protein JTB14_024710 [Gonioctena quinquepunctata]|nr:hypothetical protein JTB14_024710 [Gonioctena quinquepunctata]
MMQDIANGETIYLKNPDKYTDVCYTICEIWKKEIPEIWGTYEVNVAKLSELNRNDEDCMEDEYFNHLSNSETPGESQKFSEAEGKLEELRSTIGVIDNIEKQRTEENIAEKKITENDNKKSDKKKVEAKRNLPPLNIKPPPCLYPSVTVKGPAGMIDKDRVAKTRIMNKVEEYNPQQMGKRKSEVADRLPTPWEARVEAHPQVKETYPGLDAPPPHKPERTATNIGNVVCYIQHPKHKY